MSQEAQDVYVFPDRQCESCGRTGGGHPNRGLDNVTIYAGRQLCGHCMNGFTDWFYGRQEEVLSKWIEKQKAVKAA